MPNRVFALLAKNTAHLTAGKRPDKESSAAAMDCGEEEATPLRVLKTTTTRRKWRSMRSGQRRPRWTRLFKEEVLKGYLQLDEELLDKAMRKQVLHEGRGEARRLHNA